MEHKKMYAFIIPVTFELAQQMAGLLREPFGGYANGYVAIPPEHPCHGKDYDEIDVSVHGGLTFGERVSILRNEQWLSHDRYGADIEMLNANDVDEIPSDYYIVGFDTLHAGDNISNCDREYCVNETLSLMEQLEKKVQRLNIKTMEQIKQLTKQEAINFYEGKLYEHMSDREKAIFQLTQDRLCMPFDVFHEAIEKTLGRPVFTHEFGLNREGLIREVLGEKEPPTFDEIVGMIPKEKLLGVFLIEN